MSTLIPTAHAKTWQYDLLNVGGTGPVNLLAIKNAMIGFPLLPWVVAGSGNSVAGAMDADDRWAAAGNIVRSTAAGVAHSWIVLTHTTGFQVCWDYVASVENAAHFYISPAGLFTGGSATNRPTATDEFYGDFTGDNQVAFTAQSPEDVDFINVIHSDDGLMTYVWAYGDFGGLGNRGVWCIGVPENLNALWTPRPCVFFMEAASDNPSTLCGTSGAGSRAMSGSLPGGGSFWVLGALEFAHNGVASREMFINVQTANDISGETWMSGPIQLFSRTAAIFGRVGHLPDLYTASDSGENDDIEAAKLWKRSGAWVFPWDGVS